MAKLLKRQLTDSEKEQVLVRYGRKCFSTGHEIPASEELQFDHIRAFATGGASELDNIAPMCATHNKEKGALPLDDFRVKLRLAEFFGTGDKLTLRNLLAYLKEKGDVKQFGQSVAVSESDGSIIVESASQRYESRWHQCPTTGWKYFYATLDLSILDSDDAEDFEIGLQPRYLILDKVFDLFRHFQQHPVLQPSIGRVVSDHIRLFDGQHKIAALLWNGRRTFECKIYPSPDLRLLNQTNISAHDKFAQTRFFASVMVLKLGSQFGADFEEYKNLEDNAPKTEAGFLEYLARLDGGAQTRGQLNTRFRSYLYSSVLEHDNNKLKEYVSAGNRSTQDKPLTMDVLQKSLFSNFLHREPTTDNMATDAYKRDDEQNNLVTLMNMLCEEGLQEWDGNDANGAAQRRLDRIFRSKSMMAWSELLHGAICGKLELHDADARERAFYRALSDPDVERVRSTVRRLMNWSRWNAPTGDDIDRVLSDNKSAVKEWLKSKGLTTGYLMGAAE